MDSSLARTILTLVIITGGLYLFSPQAGVVKPASIAQTAAASKMLLLDIKNRSLADPRQGDLQIKVGERTILQVTTDEDGRLDLVSGERDVFNPIFSGTINTLTLPTELVGSWKIVFHPQASPNQLTDGVVIGTVVVED